MRLQSGVLPARFFGREKKGLKRVKQVVPAGENDSVVFHGNEDDQCRAICYALLENEQGETRIEPVLAMIDIDDDDQESAFMLASEFLGPERQRWSMAARGVQYEYHILELDRDPSGINEARVMNAFAEDGYVFKAVLPNGEGEASQVLMERRKTEL